MNKNQKPTTLKVRKGLGANYNETVLKVCKDCDQSQQHNETTLKVRKGLGSNHNETALRCK